MSIVRRRFLGKFSPVGLKNSAFRLKIAKNVHRLGIFFKNLLDISLAKVYNIIVYCIIMLISSAYMTCGGIEF